MIPYATIIEFEQNEIRFEKFCSALIEAIEGVALVTTSKTYDLGMDARSIGKSKGTHSHVLCATLAKEITPKVAHDLQRLVSQGTNPDHLFYCCSLPLTEHKISLLTAEIRRYLPSGCSIAVLGSAQLAYRAEKNPHLFRDFYHAEMQSIEQAFIRRQSQKTTADTKGLRLALLAFGSDDVQNLRRAISTRVVMDVLLSQVACTTEHIAKVLSEDLRLQRPLNADFVHGILQECTLQGLTIESGGCWQLTEKGKVEASGIPPEAAEDLLKGSEIVRRSLESLIGRTITDVQYEQIWSTLLDFLSELFYSNGLSIIAAVEQFLNPNIHIHRERRACIRMVSIHLRTVRCSLCTWSRSDVFRGIEGRHNPQ